MILSFENLISADEAENISTKLVDADFIDGATTAGWAAAQVKNNQQLPSNSPLRREISETVLTALRQHDSFRSAVQPKQLHSLIVSRYQQGMTYGLHVDNPLMGGDPMWRSDVSFTLFLSDPDDYEGGELSFEMGSGEMRVKLGAGCAVCYPSTTLHRVMPVTKGERLAVVAWVHSMIRDPAQREILADIDTARRLVFGKDGKTREFDLLGKSHANLMRRWVEP